MKGRPARIRAATIDDTRQSSAHVPVLDRNITIGPVAVCDVTIRPDMIAECDDVGTGYFVHLPISGRLESRYGGSTLTATREVAAVYQPDGGSFTGQWEAGTRVLCVRLDGAAVGSALARLTGRETGSEASFELAMNTRHGPGRTWVEQLLLLSRQPAGPDGLLASPLVAQPLAQSLVNGFLLAAEHSRSGAVVAAAAAATAEPAGPATIRKAIDLVEADPRVPLSVSDLAARCGVGARALQHGFQRHVGIPPMTYVRDVRLRRADAELRVAAPPDTVASIARRWGFAHLGRFASVYEAKYGQSPGQTLRARR